MARRTGSSGKPERRLKRGELEVFVVPFKKAELAATPPAHLAFYLSLGQLVNEVTMLQSLLLRSVQAMRGPRPARETSLGLALFLTRLMCGRMVEAHEAINSKDNARLLTELWDALPDTDEARLIRAEATSARIRINRDLGPRSSLMRLVRNKLAYHLDQQVLVETFRRMPEELELADFHTGRRGTTFFGVADTVAALAVSQLVGSADVMAGINDMAEAAQSAASDLQEFADGFLTAFYLVHFGQDRLASAPRVLLTNLPEMESASVGYYMASKRVRTARGRAADA